jgi:hypothetical protein
MAQSFLQFPAPHRVAEDFVLGEGKIQANFQTDGHRRIKVGDYI